MSIRLRQVALVASDLAAAESALADRLGLEVGFRDPGVAEFGLTNAVLPVGDGFLEVVSPAQDGTTAGRLLAKRGGDGGYMVIVQCDDLVRRRNRFADLGVRVVWQLDLGDIEGTHVHPRDVGGAILSLDEARPWPSWRWGGPAWRDHVRTGIVTGLAGVTVGADDPLAMAARWGDVLDVEVDGHVVQLDDSVVEFVAAGPRGEGVDAVWLVAADRSRAGEVLHIVGTEIRLV
jgi:catechol 2,3-dioxygenase-like lactoylglutathione lyase family enzyme